MDKIALFGVAGAIGQSIAAELSARGRPFRVVGRSRSALTSPFMREMVEMHYLLTDPVLMDDSALQRLIGPLHKTSYADGVRQCLSPGRSPLPVPG